MNRCLELDSLKFIFSIFPRLTLYVCDCADVTVKLRCFWMTLWTKTYRLADHFFPLSRNNQLKIISIKILWTKSHLTEHHFRVCWAPLERHITWQTNNGYTCQCVWGHVYWLINTHWDWDHSKRYTNITNYYTLIRQSMFACDNVKMKTFISFQFFTFFVYYY